jgi:tetratricopeptide (TPR) repeat protein
MIFLKTGQVQTLLDAWVEMWNTYDLKTVDRLFLHSDNLTYFSSEKSGIIKGMEAVKAHHRGFGFVEGGKRPESKLWLEDSMITVIGDTAVATAIWHFSRKTGKKQKGPVTFIIKNDKGGVGFIHLHFANYNPAISGKAEAISLLGEALIPPELDKTTLHRFEDKLARARKEFEKNPQDPETLIWLGRRTAYLGRYREAIEIYSRGIKKHPGDARLYRHRGHRYITVRKFNRAIADLEHAARLIEGTLDSVEPDGLPNSRNIPVSTLHTNIWYHLGLAYYLKDDLENAAEAYKACLAASGNNDMKVATLHWYYMTLRLMGKQEEASRLLEPINSNMEIIENTGYYQLLLFYKGILSLESLTKKCDPLTETPAVIYGIANWYHYNNCKKEAFELFKQIIQTGQWAAFGHIAAEVRLSGM